MAADPDKQQLDACPVDHKSREIWLQQARAAGDSRLSPHASQQASAQRQQARGWSSYIPFWKSGVAPGTQSKHVSSPATTAATAGTMARNSRLGIEREVSSIPRTVPSPGSGPATAACPVDHASLPADHPYRQHSAAYNPSPPSSPTIPFASPTAVSGNTGPASHGTPLPANNEAETGSDAASGNWVYPSELQFFQALLRKGYSAQEVDMRTVVPIHNAVNERAWHEILQWEKPYLSPAAENPVALAGTGPQLPCTMPRLHSFAGDSTKLTPKARLNGLLGYQLPFDRHDWVVDRCGKRVEYVIDFYAGRGDARGGGKAGMVNFYLDVRPKLNSWEGIKMRVLRGLGVV